MFTFSPLPHTDAVNRIAGLPLVSREVLDGMLPELRAYAFTVTGLDVGDQMAKVRDHIQAVPAGEKTWEKARKEIAAELADDLGGKASQRRAELLLRTHVFRSYAATRYRNLMQQVDVFPYWQYKTHGDGNVRPSHAALNGKIFPAGHEIWQRIFPPWDWGCRCIVVPLTKRSAEQVMQRGRITDESAKAANLLPTQIATPEIFTAQEASLIAKNQRLPNGTSLNSSHTWAEAPWSKPGNVQHDWKLIKQRYSDQPEVLAAFQKWASATEITKGLTVHDWISDGSASLPPAMHKPSTPKTPTADVPPTVEAKPQLKGLEHMENDHSLPVVSKPGPVKAVNKAAESIQPGAKPVVKAPSKQPAKPAAFGGVKPFMNQVQIEELAVQQVSRMSVEEMRTEAAKLAQDRGLAKSIIDSFATERGGKQSNMRNYAIQGRMKAIRAESDRLRQAEAAKRGIVNPAENDDSDLIRVPKKP